MRKPATTFKVYPPEAAPQATRDLVVWKKVSEMSQLLEEVSKLLEAYSHRILDSDF